MFRWFKRKPASKPITAPTDSGNANAILDRSRLDAVPCPEWGCTVYLPRWISLAESSAMLPSVDDNATTVAQIVAFAARDKDGARLFTDADIPRLRGDDYRVMMRIVERFNELHAGGDRAEKN